MTRRSERKPMARSSLGRPVQLERVHTLHVNSGPVRHTELQVVLGRVYIGQAGRGKCLKCGVSIDNPGAEKLRLQFPDAGLSTKHA